LGRLLVEDGFPARGEVLGLWRSSPLGWQGGAEIT